MSSDFVVHVREHMRRPPYSFGVGDKTVFVTAYFRRLPESRHRSDWPI